VSGGFTSRITPAWKQFNGIYLQSKLGSVYLLSTMAVYTDYEELVSYVMCRVDLQVVLLQPGNNFMEFIFNPNLVQFIC